MCTWYLAGLGATVVAIEDPEGGDALRHLPPFGPDGLGAWFRCLYAGKRSVALSLRKPAGIAAVRALLDTVDVLVEGFRPGVLARIGLDPEQLISARPDLIVASITGFGQQGPWRDRPGHDLGYAAMAGHLALGRRQEGIPEIPGLQVADMAGGALTGAMAISAALFRRERSGRGQWIDLSMTRAALALTAPVLTATAIAGEAPAPGAELLTGGVPFYGIYRCADGGLIAFPPLEWKFQQIFHAAVGEGVPLEREALCALFATKTRDEWAALLGGAAVTPVLELQEVLAHPLHRETGAVLGEGASARIAAPFGSSAVHAAAPALGEHTESELARARVDPRSLLESPCP